MQPALRFNAAPAPPKRKVNRAIPAVFAAVAACWASAAEAHPHVWVTARSEIVFDPDGAVIAVRHVWQFDEAFSAFAVQGYDGDGDGTITVAELAPLADTSMGSLANYAFFTWLAIDGQPVTFGQPVEYWYDVYGGLLTLFFTLPLAEPVPIADAAYLDVFDPEYYVAVSFDEAMPFALIDSPPRCTASFQPPPALDPASAAILAAIPAEERALPANLSDYTAELANTVNVACD